MKPRTVRADRVFLAAGLARFGLGASEQIEVWWDGEALYFRPLHGGDTRTVPRIAQHLRPRWRAAPAGSQRSEG
jgi:hypothetical protein